MNKLIIATGIDKESSNKIYHYLSALLNGEINLTDVGLITNQDLKSILEGNVNPEDHVILIQMNEFNEIINTLVGKIEIYVIRGIIDMRGIFFSRMNTVGSFNEVFSKYELFNLITEFERWENIDNLLDLKLDENPLDLQIRKMMYYLEISLPNVNKDRLHENLNAYESGEERHEKTAITWETELSRLQIGLLQYYGKKWLIKWDYPRIRTFYNYALFWKGAKLFEHFTGGTLANRLNDPFHKKQRLISQFEGTSQKKIVHNLSNDVRINLYKDSHLSKLILSDSFEKEELLFLSRYLNEGDNFIDVGSNIGLFSLIASNIVGEDGKILAIEPAKETFSRLLENINLNNFQNIRALNYGLSDVAEEKEFHIDKSGYDAWNSFGRPSSGIYFEKEIVNTQTLDMLIEKFSTPDIVLIKIDVEGWEYPVIKGGLNTLSKENAPVLMVEFTEENALNAGYRCQDVYEIGESYGYKWYKYNSEENNLFPVEKKDSYTYENLIAIKDLGRVKERLG